MTAEDDSGSKGGLLASRRSSYDHAWPPTDCHDEEAWSADANATSILNTGALRMERRVFILLTDQRGFERSGLMCNFG